MRKNMLVRNPGTNFFTELLYAYITKRQYLLYFFPEKDWVGLCKIMIQF